MFAMTSTGFLSFLLFTAFAIRNAMFSGSIKLLSAGILNLLSAAGLCLGVGLLFIDDILSLCLADEFRSFC